MGDKKSLQVQPDAVPALTQKNNFVAKGNNCIQAGQIDKVEVNVQGITDNQVADLLQGLLSQQPSNTPHCTYNELLELSRQYYHLFVLEKDFYSKGIFSVSKKLTLKHTDPNLRQKFCRISTDANQELLKMPAILATKNMEQGRTEDGHTFRVAKIDKITRQGETYCIEFRTDGRDRKQQLLNEHCKEMGLKSASHRTQLDEIHWAIIEGNLLGLLTELEI